MRLTKHMRSIIVTRVLERTFKEREARLADRESALATRVVATAYGPDVWIRTAAIPTGWLPTTKEVHFSLGEARHHRVSFREQRPLPSEVLYGRLSLPFAGNEAILDELHDIKADRDAIRSQRGQLRAEVCAVLNSVSTVERLIDLWPEGLAELPPEWMAPKSVPAPLVADLNARIAVLRGTAI